MRSFSSCFRRSSRKLLFTQRVNSQYTFETPDAKTEETDPVHNCGCPAVAVGQLSDPYRPGDVAYADAGLLLVPIRDDVEPCPSRRCAARRPRAQLSSADAGPSIRSR